MHKEVYELKRVFCQIPHIFFAALGFIFGLCAFVAFKTIHPVHVETFWIYIISGITLLSALYGLLLKNLLHCAHRDPLTGLFNRKYFDMQLRCELKKLYVRQSSLSVCIIDIDYFKSINDTYGHIAGDRLLVKIADVLKKTFTCPYTVARWGGEEFAVILPKTNNFTANSYAEKARKEIEDSSECMGVTVCAGVVTIEKPMNAEIVLEMADNALYQAKRTRNRVETVVH
ncbi:MAG TPA: GGDEF domain-containing protein [Clostridia bacterium]|nr:GGDEF domain-containing protein [Clostridia bacterium]